MPVRLADLMFGVSVVVVPEVQVLPVVFREPRVFRILDEEPEEAAAVAPPVVFREPRVFRFLDEEPEEAVAVSPPPVAVPPPAPLCMASRWPLTAGERKVLHRARWNEWRERDLAAGGGSLEEMCDYAQRWANGEL